MGCKLVGTVRGTKLWAGDCAPAADQPGSGLLARNVGAPARARPSFLPPPRERSPALPQASPRAVEDQGPAFEMVDGVMTHVRPAPASVRRCRVLHVGAADLDDIGPFRTLPPARQHAPENSNTAFEARHAYPGGFPRATAVRRRMPRPSIRRPSSRRCQSGRASR
jgi:hypothetical protein